MVDNFSDQQTGKGSNAHFGYQLSAVIGYKKQTK
jgi:hypothetical protein